mmetsp:Transcript_96345/g.171218  ORF Transcript_96345/g.171218 Transcript_96345/m.171218 type:complete len:132 (-) Transcript_96345:18-413(-)
MADEPDPLLEAEALLAEDETDGKAAASGGYGKAPPSDDEGLFPPEEAEGGPSASDPEGAEDLGGSNEPDQTYVEPKFTVGQVLKALRAEDSYAACTIVAADRTEMGPMYAVRFEEDGSIQSLVPEQDLRIS